MPAVHGSLGKREGCQCASSIKNHGPAIFLEKTEARNINQTTETEKPPPEMLPKSAVLVPLYIYPLTPKTWDPLYEA